MIRISAVRQLFKKRVVEEIRPAETKRQPMRFYNPREVQPVTAARLPRPAPTELTTGLGPQFDALVTADTLSEHRLRSPYDHRFENRKIIDIYGIRNRKTGEAEGKFFLEQVAAYARNEDERTKVGEFLSAIGRIDIEGYEELSPIRRRK